MNRLCSSLAACLCACGGSSGPAYRGVIAGSGGESGTIDLNVPDPHTFDAVGTLKLGAAPIPLNGQLDPGAGGLHMFGPGYTVTGRLQSGSLTGTFQSPSGGGRFAVHLVADVAATYCGTFTGHDAQGPTAGAFDAVQNLAGQLRIVYAGTGSGVEFNGLQTGNLVGASVAATDAASSTSGTLSGGSISGTWTLTDGTGGGNFTASAAGCPK